MKLSAKQLGRRYERAGRPFWALRHADLSVGAGDFVTVLGRSGSGKTTLLTLLLGLCMPTEGEVAFNDRALSGMSDEQISALRNAHIGYVPQHAGLVPTLTILDNIRLPWHLANRRGTEPAGRAEELLTAVGLADLGGQYTRALSGGELRRAAFARALMNSPELIVADEPTSNLDRESAEVVMGMLIEARQAGAGVLLVTHDTLGIGASNAIYDMVNGELKLRAEAVQSADPKSNR